MKQPRNATKMESPSPFEYHDEVELLIEDVSNLGLGVGRVQDWVIMVPFVIAGERVRVRIYRNHANYSDADLLEIIEPSGHRVEPKCFYFTDCGGCQYQHIDYTEQLRWKRRQVEELFARQINSAAIQVPVQEPIHSEQIYGYRSKITPHYQKPRDNQISEIGFLKPGQRHAIVDVGRCEIAMDGINEKLPEVRKEVRAKHFRKKKGGTLLLRQCMDGVETDANETIMERVGDFLFSFKAGEFFQNNPFVLPKMVKYVIAQAKAIGGTHLIDTYCGSGLFAISASRDFEKCVGIEVSASAIQWAQNNAVLNRLQNCRFQIGSAENIFSTLTCPGDEAVVVMDPPRKGSDEAFLSQLVAFAPRGVVYVSCDPATQARDLDYLLEAGMKVQAIQPVDLFPHTRHIENIVTLVRG